MPKKTEIVEMPESLAFSSATENANNVPKRMWRKWNNQARYIFNEVFNQMQDQMVMRHPQAPMLAYEQWHTLRWNFAWIAADAVMESVSKSRTDCTAAVVDGTVSASIGGKLSEAIQKGIEQAKRPGGVLHRAS